jgi:hypothetical protein
MSWLNTSIQTGFARSASEAMFPRLFPDAGWWCPSLNPAFGGSRLWDLSGKQNWGTLTSMANDDWVISGGKGALDFDGSNDYIQGGILPAGIINFAASAWIRANSGSGNALQIVSNVGPAAATGAHIMALVNGNLYAFAGSEFTSSTGDLRDNTWHQVAVSRIGNQGSFFLDGKFVQSGTIGSNVLSNATAIRIGSRGDGIQQLFAGQIDDVRLYGRAFTQPEVRQLYQVGRGNMPLRRRRRYVEQAAGGNRRRRVLLGAEC